MYEKGLKENIYAKWNGIDIFLRELHIYISRKIIRYSDVPFSARRDKTFTTEPKTYIEIAIGDKEYKRIQFDENSTVVFSVDTINLHDVKVKPTIVSVKMSNSCDTEMVRRISLAQNE